MRADTQSVRSGTSNSQPKEISQAECFGQIESYDRPIFQIEAIAASRIDGRIRQGLVTTVLDEAQVQKQLSEVQLVISDCDGTAVPSGAKRLPDLVVRQDYELRDAGVMKIYCTGKPESEIRIIAERLIGTDIYNLPGNQPYPASFLIEKGAFLVKIEPDGSLIKEPILISEPLAAAIQVLKSEFRDKWRENLSKKYNVQMEFAGDGTHAACFTVDVLKSDRPHDFMEEKYKARDEIKEGDPVILENIRIELAQLIKDLNLPGLQAIDLKEVGKASFEVTDESINKRDAVLRLMEKLNIPLSTMVATAGDSKNDIELHGLKGNPLPNVVTCHTVHDPKCDFFLETVDFAASGHASAPAFFEAILVSKHMAAAERRVRLIPDAGSVVRP